MINIIYNCIIGYLKILLTFSIKRQKKSFKLVFDLDTILSTYDPVNFIH